MTDAPSATANSDERSALAIAAELSSCELDESAWILHRWLRQRCPHDAIAVTANGSGRPLSQWTSPTFGFPVVLGQPVVTASGDAASSSVSILVVPTENGVASCSRLDAALAAMARVLAARISCLPSDTDTVGLSLAHSVAAERERVTQELTDHFAQYLHTIVNRLRDATGADDRTRVQSATSVASRALVELRESRRPVWRRAARIDEPFGVLEGDLGELARTAGIQFERTLAAPEAQILPHSLLDAAASITRAAMLNVVEHSGAARVRVEWRVDADHLVVSIVDDGSGFDPQPAAHGGLGAMRRRAEGLGGSLEVASMACWGTRIVASLPLRVVNAVHADESTAALVETLSDRELAILRLLAVGYRNREIASELFLSQHTAKFHVGKIFEKLGVRTRAEAAAVAFAAGVGPAAAAA